MANVSGCTAVQGCKRLVAHILFAAGISGLPVPCVLAADAPTAAQVREFLMATVWDVMSGGSYSFAGSSDPSTHPGVPAPLRPEWQAEYDTVRKAAAEGHDIRDYKAACKTIGIPFGVPHNLKYGTRNFIFTEDGRLYIEIGDGPKETRKIWMDGRSLPNEIFLPQYQGYSVGRWEGTSLVIETVGLRPDSPIESGLTHSDKLRVTERYSLLGKDKIRLDVILVDPERFTKPWVPQPTFFVPEPKGSVEDEWLAFLDNTCEEERSNFVNGHTQLLDPHGRDLSAAPILKDGRGKPIDSAKKQ